MRDALSSSCVGSVNTVYFAGSVVCSDDTATTPRPESVVSCTTHIQLIMIMIVCKHLLAEYFRHKPYGAYSTYIYSICI